MANQPKLEFYFKFFKFWPAIKRYQNHLHATYLLACYKN